MDVLIRSGRDDDGLRALLAQGLAGRLPGVRLHTWTELAGQAQAGPGPRIEPGPGIGPGAGIEVAVVWKPDPAMWAGMPDLRCVMALGAGVEDLVAAIPAGVLLTRVVDPLLTASMTEYVLLHVLRYHRNQPAHEADQAGGMWHAREYPRASERTVGILGLGALGADAARRLADLGFRVLGWSRGPKHVPGVHGLHGPDGLDALLGQSQIVVCLLPHTAATENILDARAFARMPRGACVINAARGAHVVDADLIAALDAGQLAGATLDVFRQEPLPATHPFWTHPGVTMTPHIASLTDYQAVAAAICDNICRLHAGQPLRDLVDRTRGY